MTFNNTALTAAQAIFITLGEAASYHKSTGVVSTVQVIVDRNIEVFPGGFDSNAAERRTEISIQKADAPLIQRGEKIVTSSDAWEVKDILEDDGIEVRVSVK